MARLRAWLSSRAAAEPMTRGARHAILVTWVAGLAVAGTSPAFTVMYESSTASALREQAQVQGETITRLNAQARTQAATIARLNTVIAQLRAQQLSSCAFARDVGTLPVADNPRPGHTGVSIITDARAWWHSNHCPGTLPVPRGLAKWAAVYHLPVN